MADTTRLAEGGDSFRGTTIPPTWGPLLPPTDLYRSPPTDQQNQSAAMGPAPFTVGPHATVTVPGKVLSFFDLRMDNGLNTSFAPSQVRYRSNLWSAFKGSLIVPTDNRYAWVPLYRRDVTYYNNTDTPIEVSLANRNGINNLVSIPASFAQVYFIPVAVRNRTLYDNSVPSATVTSSDLDAANSNLVPRLVQVEIVPNAGAYGGYVLNFVGNALTTFPTDAAVEGAYMVISDDRIIGPTPNITFNGFSSATNVNHGRMNGRIFRLGSRRPDLDNAAGPGGGARIAWELAPGFEFKRDPGANGRFFDATNNNTDNDDIAAIGNTTAIAGSNSATVSNKPALAFLIGRNPTTAAGGYEGPAQDVAAYVTFVKVN